MAHRSQLEGRLMAILDPSVPRRGLTRARAAGRGRRLRGADLPVASVQPWAEEQAAVTPRLSIADAAAGAPAQTHIDERIPDRRTLTSAATPVQRSTARQTVDPERTSRHGCRTRPGAASLSRSTRSSPTASAQSRTASSKAWSAAVIGAGRRRCGGRRSGARQARPTRTPTPTADAEARADGKGHGAIPRMVAALMDALKDTDKDVRETAMHALVQMRDPRMFEPLVAGAQGRERRRARAGRVRARPAARPARGRAADASC